MPSVQGHVVIFRRPQDGVSYELTPSVGYVTAKADGTVTTGAITLSAHRRKGDVSSAELLEIPFVAVGDHHYAEYRVDGGAWTEAQQVRIVDGLQITFAYGVPASAVSNVRTGLGLRLRHTADGGKPLLTLPDLQVVRDGQQGTPGDPGKPGEDSVRYWLQVTPNAIHATADGKYSIYNVTFAVMRQQGQQDPEQLPLDGDLSGDVFEHDLKVMAWYVLRNGLRQRIESLPDDGVLDLPANLSAIELRLRNLAGDILYDSVNVTVAYDGAKGDQGKHGIEGCIYRQSEWAEGFEYHNDRDLGGDTWPRYIDVVVIKNANGDVQGRWMCRATHVSGTANKPVAGDSQYWVAVNAMEPIYTPLLLADNAVIKLTQTNEVIIVNDDNVVALHLGKGQWPLWIGAANSADAPYKVDITGALHATRANITGEIHATSGKIGDWEIVNGHIKSPGAETNIDFDASAPQISMSRGLSMSYMSPDGILANWAGVDALDSVFDTDHMASLVGLGNGNLDTLPGLDPLARIVAGVYGTADNAGSAESYGGYFDGLMAAGLCLKPRTVEDGQTIYLNNDDTMVISTTSTTAAMVYLPANPRYGQVHFFKQWYGDRMVLRPQGKHIIRLNVNPITSHEVSGGHWAMAIFYRTVDREISADGVWLITGV